MMIDCDVARKEDTDQLVALLGILFSQEAELSPDPRKQRRALEAILADPARATLYVAREAGRVIAMAALHFGTSTAEGGKAAWLEDMCVLPEARGRGVGPALLRFVLEDAKRQEVLRVTLLTDADNHRAQGLYRKLGFTASSMLAMRLHL
jgi:ribosomal protein S18 acetylase RimI-like enzyme